MKFAHVDRAGSTQVWKPGRRVRPHRLTPIARVRCRILRRTRCQSPAATTRSGTYSPNRTEIWHRLSRGVPANLQAGHGRQQHARPVPVRKCLGYLWWPSCAARFCPGALVADRRSRQMERSGAPCLDDDQRREGDSLALLSEPAGTPTSCSAGSSLARPLDGASRRWSTRLLWQPHRQESNWRRTGGCR